MRTKKDSYPLPQIQETIESLFGAGYFSSLDVKAGLWQIAMDKASKQYTASTQGNLGFFECECMPFGLCNAPAMFQKLMQKYLDKLKLAYYLIYLDDITVFLKIEEEHYHHLCIVLEHFREHHLKLKLTKCDFFKSEINYLAHHVSKEGVQPSKENLKAMAEFTPPWTYTGIQAFLGLVGHNRKFIKGFAHIAQPLHEHLSGEGASKKNEQVMLMENALGTFKTLKKACHKAPMLVLNDFNKPFLLETDVSKLGLGTVLSQKQTDGRYHLVAYARRSLTIHECNYHSTKLGVFSIKVGNCSAVSGILTLETVVKTNNNLLTYIMTTSNLDGTQHHWVESLVGFTFSIEYQTGWDNAVTDALSQVISRLDAEIMKSLLDGITVGTIGRTDTHDPAVVEADEEIHKQVWETVVQARAAHACVNLHVTDWVATQQEDPILKTMMEWISEQKVQDLKHLLGDTTNMEEGKAVLWERKSRCSTKEPFTIATHQLASWKKFCGL